MSEGASTSTNPRGRPSAYKPEFAAQAEKLCQLGATDMELADFFDVEVRTIYRWKHDHDEFCQSLCVGKEVLDDRVERSLYQRAVGYSFNSEKIFHFQGHITRADTVEHVPPDGGAAMLWLKNRRGDKWRDKQDHEHTGKNGGAIEVRNAPDLSKLTLEEARELELLLAKTSGARDASAA